MSATRTVAVLIGSLRKDSFSGRIVKALQMLAPANLKFEVLEIGQLPFFN
jgi:chromate reductase